MNTTPAVIDAVASSPNILDRDEAEQLVRLVAPHYRDGRLPTDALMAACRYLYDGFDRYQHTTQAALQREARTILRLGEDASAAETAATSPDLAIPEKATSAAA